jgi:hypothetical protein
MTSHYRHNDVATDFTTLKDQDGLKVATMTIYCVNDSHNIQGWE